MPYVIISVDNRTMQPVSVDTAAGTFATRELAEAHLQHAADAATLWFEPGGQPPQLTYHGDALWLAGLSIHWRVKETPQGETPASRRRLMPVAVMMAMASVIGACSPASAQEPVVAQAATLRHQPPRVAFRVVGCTVGTPAACSSIRLVATVGDSAVTVARDSLSSAAVRRGELLRRCHRGPYGAGRRYVTWCRFAASR